MTVDKQPRALYLADVLAAGFECDQEWYEIESAKELRRLHKLLGISNALARVRYERIKILTGQRDELLEALRSVWLWMEDQADGQSKGGHATFDLMLLKEQRDIAGAAIAKATGETK